MRFKDDLSAEMPRQFPSSSQERKKQETEIDLKTKGKAFEKPKTAGLKKIWGNASTIPVKPLRFLSLRKEERKRERERERTRQEFLMSPR